MTYYTNAPQTYGASYSNQWNAQVSNWSNHQSANTAKAWANNWFPGWTALDSRWDGSHYVVHVRDSNNHYRTVYMDQNFHHDFDQDGYH
jgi:hypothetical protein